MRIIEGQLFDGYCGVACLAYVAQETGRKVGQLDIAGVIDTTQEKGTSHEQMLWGVAFLGLQGMWKQNEPLSILNRMVKDGLIVIVNWMDGKDHRNDGHYSILMEANGETVTLNDPDLGGRITIVRQKDFEEKWWDIDENDQRQKKWALIISK